MTREERITVFHDTLTRSVPCKVQNRFYQGGLHSKQAKHHSKRSDIVMVHGGTVNSGYLYADDMRVAILNFANDLKYGGYVEDGSNAQEENICRCTNLYVALSRNECHDRYYMPNAIDAADERRFDIGTDRVIYSRGVKVFKDDTTYEIVPPKYFDVITCASPSIQLDNKTAYNIYIKRIEQIVLSAIANRAECVVLGAWGCGAFGQNPRVMARAFAKVLDVYGGYFKKIVFAIKATTAERNDDVYDTFKEIFDIYYKGKVVEA